MYILSKKVVTLDQNIYPHLARKAQSLEILIE